MRLSRFNQYVPTYPGPNEVLVHNTLAGSFAVLTIENLERLRRSEQSSPLSQDLREYIDTHELADSNVGIVVTSHEEEELEFRKWLASMHSQSGVFKATVSLNLACNFACPYCCQAEVMDGSVMKTTIASQTSHWIVNRAKSQLVDSVELVFVGGEPLLHPTRLEMIVRTVAEALTDLGIAFSFAIVTNGVFLDQTMLDRLVPMGLKRAQITLDGDASTHEISRVSKTGASTFDLIFENAIRASRVVEVRINGNYQRSTITGFVPLLDQLAQAGLPSGSTVTFSPALGSLASPTITDEKLAATWSDSGTEYQIALYDEILRHGFHIPPPNQVGPCEFHQRHAVAIGHDGTIYKCVGFLGQPSWSIGHVESCLNERFDAMLANPPPASCDGCSHRPNCGGGCVAEAMIQSGSLASVSCEKPYFDRNTHEAVCRDFRLATEDDALAAAAAFPSPRQPLPKPATAPLNVSSGRRSRSLSIL